MHTVALPNNMCVKYVELLARADEHQLVNTEHKQYDSFNVRYWQKQHKCTF